MSTETCKHCQRSIDLTKDKYVLLGTYNGTGKAKKAESFYHFQCWVDNFNAKIIEKVQNSMTAVMGNAPVMVKDMLKGLKVNVR